MGIKFGSEADLVHKAQVSVAEDDQHVRQVTMEQYHYGATR